MSDAKTRDAEFVAKRDKLAAALRDVLAEIDEVMSAGADNPFISDRKILKGLQADRARIELSLHKLVTLHKQGGGDARPKHRKPTQYRMRAECMQDAIEFLRLASVDTVTISYNPGTWYPDVNVDFVSLLSLTELHLALNRVPDGHVMFETLAYASEYTGDR